MQYKIGIYGSYIAESEAAMQAARDLGGVLAQQGLIVVTGGCSGMPYIVARAAKDGGTEVWGFTPEYDEEGQRRAYPQDEIATYDRLFYTSRQYDQHFHLDQPLSPARDESARLKYRNVVSTVHADAGIIVSGGWGTMNEFTNLLYDSKPVGVLTGTGWLADELPDWFPRLRKKSASVVLFNNHPAELVASLLNALGG